MTVNNRAWAAAALGSFMIFLFGYIFVPAPWYGEIGNAIMFSVALGVAVTYSLIVGDAIRHPHKSKGDILVVGIWIGSIAIAARGLLSLYWRFIGRPDDITDGFIWMFVVFLSTVSAALHLLSPGAIEGRIPNRNFTRLGGYAAFGAVMVSLALWWTAF